ncbi:EmrB/QacA subfamily drug resistance transporter [Microbacterium sp. SLBN-154]|uniref:MFS transporter n=1 Tax=Microbacterium sp. SLBN-154 TaxID=2768458 RepID=UPI00114F5FB3|nr:MFS transporter [Microbacterium sp. SLBN-154]TQK18530.1 EmrB/QacA subfamily drug resistance transporter [Microbacterium sp. SLBN-154]
MSAPSVASPRTSSEGRLRGLLISLCVALALVVAGNSALAIALPDIATDLEADQSELTWIIDAYALTFAAFLLTAGLLADKIGRRTVIIVGLAVFGAASLASAFAPDPAWFIALRAISGAGAAAIFPVTLSALVDAYPPERRTFAIAVWSGVSSAGAVGGTIVAGVLLEWFWWGSVQLLFGGVALLLVIPSVILVAQNRNPRLSADPLAALWSVLALTGIVFAVIEGPKRGWDDALVLVALVVGVLGVGAFIVHQLRAKQPSLDVRLFRSRGLSAGSLIVTAQFFASLGLFVLAPQYLQLVQEFTPLGAALSLLVIPVGVGAGIGGSVALARRFGQGTPGALGLVLMAAGFAGAALTLAEGTDASIWVLAVALAVFGVGFGMGITPGTELIIEGLPAERRSIASAVNDITREVGGVLGIAVLSSVLLSSYRDEIAGVLDGVPEPAQEVIESGAGAAIGASEAFGPAGDAIAEAARDAFAIGLGSASWVAAAVLAATAVVCIALVPPRRRSTTTA